MKKISKFLVLMILFSLTACGTKDNQKYKSETDKSIKESIEKTIKETENIEEQTQKKEIKTTSLLYIMPKYKNEIYSKAYFRQFVKNDLKQLREAYGQLVDCINNEEMDETSKIVAIKNYKQIEEVVLSAERNEINQDAYNSLAKAEYFDYIKKETNYYEDEKLSRENYSLNIISIKTYDMYYSFECNINIPYLISKKEINRLNEIMKEDEDEATTIIELPVDNTGYITSRRNGLEIKKIKMYYDGENALLYYLKGKENDNNLREISIKDYNNDFYALYEDDYWPIEHPEKNIIIKVLRDANIGEGQDFRQIALADEDYNYGDDDTKYYYNIEDLFRRVLDNEKTIISNKTVFNANYVKFDDKGYVTDIYWFEE